MGGLKHLARISTSMLSLMTRLRKAIHTFVSEKRKLKHNYSTGISPIPQKLIANYSVGLRGLAVPRAGNRSFVTGLIHGESRSHLIYIVAHSEFGKEGGTTRGLAATLSSADGQESLGA